MAELFSTDFVAAVSRMRLSAGSVPRGGRHGEQGSVQLGAGMEFRDFRAYMPGDDIRRIDWNLYRRSGRLFLRLFEEERDLPVYILLDCSDSMFFEAPPRADAAKQAAAILVGAALNQHDRPAIYPFGEALNEGFPAIPNSRSLPATLGRLATIGPAGPTNLRSVLHRLGAMRLRKGVVAIVSDFFDPAGIDSLVESMHGIQHKLLLVQLCRASDAEPQLDGELSLVDCETGHDLRVSVTPRTVEAYQQAYSNFQDKLLQFAGKRRAGYITLNADGDVLEQFMNMFAGGVITTRG
jgi:uncharacterized protein (DUF58 family)